ncbi:MAG: response regulator, partial [Defluviitaleaceae bacterium]|nr:response regulator [Defluviitaleaceae bacterium]
MKTIFLVDDDIANLKLGSSVLGELYNVITLNSGTRLLKMLLSSVDAANLPSLILLDIDMPEMNGYETISRIKKIDALSEIPVIFLTAKNNNENELKGLALGAIDYITKPFSAALLLKRIEIHLQLLEQKQELVRFNTNLQEMVDEKTLAVVELQNAIVQTISEMVDYHDDTTGSHILRTQAYLRILIEGLQKSGFKHNLLSNMNVELILQSSQLHDVGKIKVDSSILRKPGKLTDEERAEMEKHTIAG